MIRTLCDVCTEIIDGYPYARVSLVGGPNNNELLTQADVCGPVCMKDYADRWPVDEGQ